MLLDSIKVSLQQAAVSWVAGWLAVSAVDVLATRTHLNCHAWELSVCLLGKSSLQAAVNIMYIMAASMDGSHVELETTVSAQHGK